MATSRRIKRKTKRSNARFIVALGKGNTLYVVLARRAIRDAALAKALTSAEGGAGVTRAKRAFVVSGPRALATFMPGVKFAKFGVRLAKR